MSEQTFVSDEWIGTQIMELFPNLDNEYRKEKGEPTRLLDGNLMEVAAKLSYAIRDKKSVDLGYAWNAKTSFGNTARTCDVSFRAFYLAELAKVVVYNDDRNEPFLFHDEHLPSTSEAKIIYSSSEKGVFPIGVKLRNIWCGEYKWFENGLDYRGHLGRFNLVMLYSPSEFVRTWLSKRHLPSWMREKLREGFESVNKALIKDSVPQTVVDDRKNRDLLLSVLDVIGSELAAAYDANDDDSVLALQREWRYTQERLEKGEYTKTYKSVFDARLSLYYPNNTGVFYVNATKVIELIRQWNPMIKPVALGAILGKTGLFEDNVRNHPDIWDHYMFSSFFIQRTSPAFYKELLKWHNAQCRQGTLSVSQPIHTDNPTNTPATDWEKMTSENNDIQEYLKQHPDKVKEYNEWLINNL